MCEKKSSGQSAAACTKKPYEKHTHAHTVQYMHTFDRRLRDIFEVLKCAALPLKEITLIITVLLDG